MGQHSAQFCCVSRICDGDWDDLGQNSAVRGTAPRTSPNSARGLVHAAIGGRVTRGGGPPAQRAPHVVCMGQRAAQRPTDQDSLSRLGESERVEAAVAGQRSVQPLGPLGVREPEGIRNWG